MRNNIFFEILFVIVIILISIFFHNFYISYENLKNSNEELKQAIITHKNMIEAQALLSEKRYIYTEHSVSKIQKQNIAIINALEEIVIGPK